jgi:hypothetical protein
VIAERGGSDFQGLITLAGDTTSLEDLLEAVKMNG